MPSLIHAATPGAIPSDVRDLLARFGFSLPKLLTTSNPKTMKGETLGHGRGLILHHLPAKALARAITPANEGSTTARGFIPSLLELAERASLPAAASAHGKARAVVKSEPEAMDAATADQFAQAGVKPVDSPRCDGRARASGCPRHPLK